MVNKKKITPKQIKFLEKVIDQVKTKKRPIRAEVMSCTVPAWGSMRNEKDHKETLSLMEYVKYDFGFMFSYSERPGTPAAKKMSDNIPEEIKKRRL